MEYPSMRPLRNIPTVQNFHLVWLDETIKEENNDEYRNSITSLRQVVNTVNTFIDVDECIDFITEFKLEKSFMIISEHFSQIIVPVVQDIPQISSIYIFGDNKVHHEKWTKDWSKIKGFYTNIISLCDALKQAVQNDERNDVSISFMKSTNGVSNENLDTLDQSFMYTQILKEILLTIEFQPEHVNEFLTYCREQFGDNTAEMNNLDKIEKEYSHYKPIWWYTHQYILYSMINRALRTMEVELIITMGFFVRDLHNDIARLHAEQFGKENRSDSFTVYRGQGLSKTDFDQLKKSQGGLMSFNNFLSTSLRRTVSFLFAESNQYNPDLIGVLFEIQINPSIQSSPFANINKVTYYQEEAEILFSMHTVFRIGQIKQIDGNNRLWQVELKLTSDTDPQLHDLTKSLQEETSSSYKGWHRLGHLMIQLGYFKKAEKLYTILLKQTNDVGEKGNLFYRLGWTKHGQGEYAEALKYYEKSIEISQKALPTNHSSLASSYHNIGLVYQDMGEYSKALSYYDKNLEISQKTLTANHSSLATSYNNIGFAYQNMGEYPTALSYYEKGLKIKQKALPANHPALATSYNNIGLVYQHMGDYSKALSYYEEGLEIQQKALPENHPSLATTYNNIGLVYYNMRDCSKALSCFGKGLEILRKALPANHPSLATFYSNISSVYCKMEDYSKALSYYEKNLEISQKTLPDLAASYNNIGEVYCNMGDYSKALSYYETELEVRQKILPANDPSLATSYNYMGFIYESIGDYRIALSYFERALNIEQRSLHPDQQSIKNVTEMIDIVKKKL